MNPSQPARPVTIPLYEASLQGDLHAPPDAAGVVLFAHGSGSSRLSARNRYVAGRLQEAGLGTLLFDLLTSEEEEEDRLTARLRFDVDLLSRRLLSATQWLKSQADVGRLPFGYFGASTGAAAALVAAASEPATAAVVSRGGRPDLAGDALPRVQAPTLLIVGELDHCVIGLNEAALRHIRCEKDLRIVPGATHLFEEPGTLEQAADLATEWFRLHLAGRGRNSGRHAA